MKFTRTFSFKTEITKFQFSAKTSTRKNLFYTETSNLSLSRLNLDKLPCASLLIRIRNAPKIGFRLLKLADVKLKDRDKMGVWPFPKAYSQGTYCNSECRVNEAELKLFETLSNDVGRIKKSKETIEAESINFSIKINK